MNMSIKHEINVVLIHERFIGVLHVEARALVHGVAAIPWSVPHRDQPRGNTAIDTREVLLQPQELRSKVVERGALRIKSNDVHRTVIERVI